MQFTRRTTLAAATALAVVLLPPSLQAGPAKPPAPPVLTTLQPGGLRTIEQTLTVNVVFVGYEPGAGPRDIDEAAFRAVLSSRYETIHRYPAYYGLPAKLGVNFDYAYKLVYAEIAHDPLILQYVSAKILI